MTNLTKVSRLLGLLTLLGLSASSLSPVYATSIQQSWPWPPSCPESNRFGVIATAWIDDYDVSQLNAGWYHQFGQLPFPPHPAGMGFVQTIRLSDDGPMEAQACSTCPTWDSLRGIVQSNPGSLWLIGNEPDRQDFVSPGRYAELYHDFYTFLKNVDRTSLVGIGGVVQPTPVRLQYLDLILDAYQNRYGKQMPIDVWNTHNYVLREKRWYEGCPDCWGCDIPPDIPSDTGILYEIQDHDKLAYWTWHLKLLREWMADRGYRDRPLIVSEFGILMPEEYGFDYTRVRKFMLGAFNWMMSTTDPAIGYPADGNRLVQAWAWYSLDDAGFEGWLGNSHLFDPDTQSITALGLDYAAYTAPLTSPAIDLQPIAIGHTPPEPEGSTLVAITVLAHIQNAGSATAENVLVRFKRDGVPAGEVTIPSIAGGETQIASIAWPNLPRGQTYQVTVTVDPDAQLAECDIANNQLTLPLMVTDLQLYLPLVIRQR